MSYVDYLEYPRYVFKAGGELIDVKGRYSVKLVNSKAEFDAALEDGWFEEVEETFPRTRPALHFKDPDTKVIKPKVVKK